jgi:hypothetical protein
MIEVSFEAHPLANPKTRDFAVDEAANRHTTTSEKHNKPRASSRGKTQNPILCLPLQQFCVLIALEKLPT